MHILTFLKTNSIRFHLLAGIGLQLFLWLNAGDVKGQGCNLVDPQVLDGGGEYCATEGSSEPERVILGNSQSTVRYSLYAEETATDETIETTQGIFEQWGETGEPVVWPGAWLTEIPPGDYIVVGKRGGTCYRILGMINITAVSPPESLPVIGGGTYCTGASFEITLGGTGGQYRTLYQLYRNNVAVGTPKQKSYQQGLQWTSADHQNLPGTYTVKAESAVCTGSTVEMIGSAEVVLSDPLYAAIDGPTLVCNTGTPAILTAITGEGDYTYQWSLNGQVLGTDPTLTVTASGTYSLLISEGACQSVTTHQITVSSPPAAITAVSGLLTNFPNQTNLINIQGSADATSFGYSSNAVWTTASGAVPGQQAYLGASTVGSNSIQVTPYKNGCAGSPYSFNFVVISPTKELPNLLPPDVPVNLVGKSDGYFHLDKHINNYPGCISQYKSVDVQIKLDMGNTFNMGSHVFTGTATVDIEAYYDIPGVTQTWPVTLSISNTAPEQFYVKTIDINPALLKFIRVVVKSHSASTSTAQAHLRLWASYSETYDVNVQDVSTTLVTPGNSSHLTGTWEQTFSWSSCPDVSGYMVQLIRLYGTSTTPTEKDWSQALSVYHEGIEPTVTLSLAEGSIKPGEGYYWWRVIPIGNLTDGLANPANWGVAATAFKFTYDHPEDNKNWIYSRTFTEDNSIHEQVVYANGLQQVAQQQTRLQEENQVVASQTMQDYVGRNALTSLPIPTNRQNLSYIDGLLRAGGNPFRVTDFDADDKLKSPTAAADYSGYYSGKNNEINPAFNAGVASAEGYPYTRTLFAADGRVVEQSGVGKVHSVAGGKTVKTYYSNPTEGELVRVMGAEAPLATSIVKITTIDANGTGSVTYQTKDGKVVATALSLPASPQLTPLGGVTAKTMSETVRSFERIDDNTIVSRKPLFYTEPNLTVSIEYEIDPTQLATLCQYDQFGDPVSPCQTCDYNIELKIYKEGDTNPIPLGAGSIQAGACGQVSGWNPGTYSFQPEVGVNYTLEKRITLNNKVPDGSATYLEQHYKAIDLAYARRFSTSSTLLTIKGYINSGDYKTLKQFISPYFNTDQGLYVLPIGGDAACLPAVITIPDFDVCEEDVFDAGTCTMNGKNYWEYFTAYTQLADPGSALFFVNRIDNTKIPYTGTVFNSMMANLIADNGLDCEYVWKVWQEEVNGYEANITRDLNVDTGDMGEDGAEYAEDAAQFGAITAKPYSLLENFFSSLDAMLQAQIPAPVGNTPVDMCALRNGYQYFIIRDQLYGKIAHGNSNYIQPAIQYAYKLVYYDTDNQNHVKALEFYAGESAGDEPNEMFNDDARMDDCERYKFSINSEYTQENLLEEGFIETQLDELKDKCNQACESREEEFRQAIIHSLMSSNAGTVIEFYHTYQEPLLGDRWLGVYDSSINISDFTISRCELEAMTTAVVNNCKTNYCNVSLTPFDSVDLATGNTVRVYGTYEERLKIKKVLTYDFELSLNETCDSNDDFISKEEATGGEGVVWIKAVTVESGHVIFDMDSNGNSYFIKKSPGGANFLVKLSSTGIETLSMPLLVAEQSQSAIQWYEIKIDGIGNKILIGGNENVYIIAKFGNADNFLWSQLVTYSDPKIALQVDIDPNNNIYLTGSCNVDLNFSQNIGQVANVTSNKMFVAKYDNSLNYLWHGTISGENRKFKYHNQVDNEIQYQFDILHFTSTGQVVIPFSVTAPATVVFPNFTRSITESGSHLISVGQTGNQLWYQAINGLSITDITVGESNNIYLKGVFGGSISFQGSTVLTGTNEEDEHCVMKLNSLGNLVWVKSLNLDTYHVYPMSSIRFDKQSNEIVIVGFLQGNVDIDLDPSPNSEFIVNGNNTEDANYYAVKYSTALEFIKGGVIAGRYLLERSHTYGGYVFDGDIFFAGLWIDFQSEVAQSGPFICRWDLPTSPCEVNHSICFRFTDPRDYTVTIPENMTEYVFTGKGIPCAETQKNYLIGYIDQQIEQLVQAEKEKFRATYFNTCADPSKISDQLTLSYSTGIHHFTLYYYDRAGNLIRTVPPEGVAELDVSTPQSIIDIREDHMLPAHLMVTEYQYNSLGQLVREHSPDGTPKPNNLTERPLSTVTAQQMETDETYYNSMIYNSIGQVRFSRNALQKQTGLNGTYSYTKYDELGRIIEVGEASGFEYDVLFSNRDEKGTNSFPAAGTQVTRTYYSIALSLSEFASFALPQGYEQLHINNRVSFSVLDEDGIIATTHDNVLTAYSYDVHGNVEWLVQFIPDVEPRLVKYSYDLLSGKVKQVTYSPGEPDQFMHRYEYDASNRLKKVFTSTDGELWETEARYSYYLHGPLKRVVLGEDEVQGVDYTYTIHGWLKALNHPYLDKTNDPGKDAAVGTTSVTGRDIFGMALGYYKGDYYNEDNLSFNTVSPDFSSAAFSGGNMKDLYNGNIASWGTNVASWIATGSEPHKSLYPNLSTVVQRAYVTHVFNYDELNRLMKSTMRTGTGFASVGNSFSNDLTYSPNGNILTHKAYASVSSNMMDNLTYIYPKYNNRPLSNRLQQVTDAAPLTSGTMSIDDVENGQATDNYQYDAIGNIVRDKQQQTKITWTPYGKVKRVDKTDANGELTGDYVAFRYDAAGNRVAKTFGDINGPYKHHFYVRDASGNIMAVYEQITGAGITNPEISVLEIPIYGSDRLGVYKPVVSLGSETTALQPGEVRLTTSMEKNAYENQSYLVNPSVTLTLGNGFSFSSTTANGATTSFGVRVGQAQAGAVNSDIHTRRLSNRQYELKDHLGNVRAVVSDLKLSTFTGTTPGNFEPLMLSMANYYPFGMDMPGRMWSNDRYRYGFNGKEKDDNGEWGNTAYDYGFRIYNPSIGKFLSVDPLTRSYPMLTPYQFASNTPIAAVDLDGLESKFVFQWLSQPHGDGTRTVIKTQTVVKPDLVHPQAYAAGLAGKAAVTETHYFDSDGTHLGEEFYYEAINDNWPKPSAYYDYTQQAIPGKGADDKAFAGFDPGLWALILARDANAPDNAGVIEDIEVLTASQGLPIFGRWMRTTETMSAEAAAYQKQITGKSANRSYLLNGTKFDGLKNGTLIDAKSGYSNFINKKTGEFHSWFKGANGLVDQARRQIKAAGGNPIEWHFENQSVRDATEKLFKKNNISDIKLTYTPKK